MICLAGLVVPETADVWLHLALLFDFNSDDLDLAIFELDLHLEDCGHLELISLD